LAVHSAAEVDGEAGAAAVKVGKHYLGKYVEVIWRDPGDARFSISPDEMAPIPRGRGCLATWKERGIIADITDGVLSIVHSEALPAPLLPGQCREYVCTYVPEELVERIIVKEDAKEEAAT
jgi:hypothetical protein